MVVEQQLQQLIKEFQAGRHEGSILTVATEESLADDERDTWRTIRKELEDIGISVAAFDANKEFIMKWFRQAIATGAFEEQNDFSDIDPTSNSHTEAPFQAGSQRSPKEYDMDPVAPVEPPLSAPAKVGHSSVQVLSHPKQEGLHLPKDVSKPDSQKLRTRARPPQPRIAALVTRLRGLDNRFIDACFSRDFSKAARLLEKGANINTQHYSKSGRHTFGNTALYIAAARGDIEMASWLLDHGADVEAPSREHKFKPLHMASGLMAQIDLNTSSKFSSKVEENQTNLEMVKLLISHGASVDIRGSENQTPLMCSIKAGWAGVLLLLIQYGADIHAKQLAPFESPLLVAVIYGMTDIVKILLGLGANANDSDSNKSSVLQIALEKPYFEIATLLIQSGADVNYKSPSNRSMLQIATGSSLPKARQLIDLMLEHGCDLELKCRGDVYDGTALDWALFSKDMASASYLIRKGAVNNHQSFESELRLLPFSWFGDNKRRYFCERVVSGYKELESWDGFPSRRDNSFTYLW